MLPKTQTIVLLFCAAFFIVGCGAQPEQTPQIIEQGNFQGEPFISELPISNCNSEEPLQTSQRIDQKYTHEVEITPAPNAKVNRDELAKAVREHYEVTELVEVASYTVAANVPSGFIYTYQVEWTEVWRKGDIEIGEIDNSPEATYTFLEDLTGGVIGFTQAKCS